MTPLPTLQIGVESIGFDWRKFWRKAAIRLAYRAIEMSILVGIGLAFGLHLIKY